MKKNITLQHRLLVLPLFFFFCCIELFSQNVGGQCGNFIAKVESTGSECGQNGSIKITLSGADVEGVDPNFSDIQYRAFITGTDSTDVLFAKQNIISGLAPGKYTVEVQGKCKAASGGVIPKLVGMNVVVQQLGSWQPLGNMNVTVNRNPLVCLNTGKVTLSNLTGGIGPYKIEIVSAPSGDSPRVVYTGATRPTGNSLIVDDLASGTYVFRFSEGSSCASSIDQTVTMGAALSPTATSLFSPYIFPESYATNIDNVGCGFTIVLSSGTDYSASAALRSQYFEYCIYYDGDDISDLSALNWQQFSSTDNSSYIRILNPRYSISEMQIERAKGNAKLIPNVIIRVKGCDYTSLMKFSLRQPSITGSVTYSGCGDASHTWSMWSDYDGSFCYPYSWTLKNSSGTVIDGSSTRGGDITWSKKTSYTVSPLSSGSYTYTFTDSGGYSWTKGLNVAASVSGITYSYASLYTWGCNMEYTPYIYVSGTGFTLKSLKNIKYLYTEKSSNNTTWVTDASFPAPTFTNIDIDESKFPTSTNNPSVFPWAKSQQYLYAPNTSIYYDSQIADLKDRINTIDPGQEKAFYRHYFQITDICGNVKQVLVNSPSTFYSHEEDPVFVVENQCNGNYRISISNLEKTILSYNRYNTGSNRAASALISQYPSGASFTYSNSSYYLYLSSQYVEVNKPGRYVFSLSTSTSAINTSGTGQNDYRFCGKTFEVIVEEPEKFSLDFANTAMYRCEGSLPGEGYIEVAVKNGKGPFRYELYDENRTLLGSNTTGIFQNWAATVTSDKYYIKAYDDYCAPNRINSFEQQISVYDLGNETTAWSPQPNVCLSDSIVLQALALGTTTYKWYFIDDAGTVKNEYTGRRLVLKDADFTMKGRYVSEVSVPGCNGALVRDTVSISVGENLMYWKPDAEDSNWFNVNNWLKVEDGIAYPVATIPAPCTTVHIPGNSTNYPNLHKDGSPWDKYGYPACDTIFYHYGSATAYPGYLNYNRAIVQYDFGYYGDDSKSYGDAPGYIKDLDHGDGYPNINWGDSDPPVLSRAQWYMLGTPLKKIVGGDFGLGGYPKMYQRLFNTTQSNTGKLQETGFTTAFSKYNIETSTTGNALALWVPDYDDYLGSRDHKYLEDLKGVLEMPYIFNADILSKRPVNEYNVSDSTSIFYYFNKNSLKVEKDQFDTFQRGYQSYRFVFENDQNSKEQIKIGSEYVAVYRQQLPDIKSGAQSAGQVMIGNPFMSHISFDRLYSLNSTLIKPYYTIIEGVGETTQTYNIGSPLNDLDDVIAPMQAFIIEKRNAASSVELLYHLDGDNSVMAVGEQDSPLGKVRSTQSKPQGTISVSCIVPKGGSAVSDVSTKCGILFNYGQVSDVPKSVFTGDMDLRAEVAVVGTHDESLYSQHSISVYPKPSVIKLAVYTTNTTKDLRLPIQINGSLIKSVRFVDKKDNKEYENIPLNWEYSFRQKSGVKDLGKSGMDANRFELHVEYNPEDGVGINTEELGSLFVHYASNTLSLESDKAMESVRMTSMSGVVVFESRLSGVRSSKHNLSLPSGAYLVQIQLLDGSLETRKIIVE